MGRTLVAGGGKIPWQVKLNSKPDFNLIYSGDCGKFTKTAKATGLENIGAERTLSGLLGSVPVNSPASITLENNGKIRPQPEGENAFAGASGGGNATAVEPSFVDAARFARTF